MHGFSPLPPVLIETSVWLLPFCIYFLLERVDTSSQKMQRRKVDWLHKFLLFPEQVGTRATPTSQIAALFGVEDKVPGTLSLGS